MKREAWEAMNNSVSSKYKLKVNHQIVTDSLIEDLHEAGFVIVPHEITDEMLEDGGSLGDEYDTNPDQALRDWYSAALVGVIQNRQRSEQ
jgi:hypothetical protein